MFENLKILKSLERQRKEIIAIERQLCEPLLSDVEYIKKLHAIMQLHYDMSKTEARQVFIMIVLLFYSPKKLVMNTKIGQRVMKMMCEVTGCSQSLLSHNSKNLIFYYQHYNEFHRLVDDALRHAQVLLVEEGMTLEQVRDYVWRFKA